MSDQEPEMQMLSKDEVLQIRKRVEEEMNHIVERVYNTKYVGRCN